MALLQSFGGLKIVVSEMVLVMPTVRELPLTVGKAESEDDDAAGAADDEAIGDALNRPVENTQKRTMNMYKVANDG